MVVATGTWIYRKGWIEYKLKCKIHVANCRCLFSYFWNVVLDAMLEANVIFSEHLHYWEQKWYSWMHSQFDDGKVLIREYILYFSYLGGYWSSIYILWHTTGQQKSFIDLSDQNTTWKTRFIKIPLKVRLKKCIIIIFVNKVSLNMFNIVCAARLAICRIAPASDAVLWTVLACKMWVI